LQFAAKQGFLGRNSQEPLDFIEVNFLKGIVVATALYDPLIFLTRWAVHLPNCKNRVNLDKDALRIRIFIQDAIPLVSSQNSGQQN
jgi:hypothetical protein